MSQEFINGTDPDANKQWAGLFYNNLDLRTQLMDRLGIKFLTDGSIYYNKNETCEFIKFIATDDNGVEWEIETTEEQKFETANDVVCHFFDMIVEGNNYLAKFSVN
jgi:hypothetical protein